ncbi:YdeI/OmpD-associated family protein [Hymenobacter tibetensis]|uniref:YdeI/OmpD-associated family protein n=1 Tax=Hymenobacter tibetensis TaxID=497967 RepID=A0ABY4CX55_9BACT|nr:YdeI/OmpD-associated family protein [Hymenobacter tibetensis]UOG74853.1 YdeI/OmpD-associated family protein [Hymenobacter tibetensis]
MTPAEQELDTFCPTSRQHWREWLQEHHDKKQSVWLIYYKKKANKPSLVWSEAVDEALCFGWIDSKAKPVDEEKYMQFFCRRKPTSAWSRINKEKVERLVEQGLMTAAGLAKIETAKQNGSWTILDAVEALLLPSDLEQELQKRPNAQAYFLGLSKTDKRNMLQWLVSAKRPETRQTRLTELVELAEQHLKPKQFRGSKTTPKAELPAAP